MRKVFIAGLVAAAAACSGDSPRSPAQPDSVSLPLRADAAQHADTPHNHSVHLSGDQEVPPVDTNAQGQAIVKIAEDNQSFEYKLIASNISNVTMAHIHCGSSSGTGPVMVWLYPDPAASGPLPGGAGPHNGVLAEGTVVETNVRDVRADHPDCPGGVSTLADVLARIRAGQAYVNVHTNDGVDPANTGPGDFPGGEVRGQM